MVIPDWRYLRNEIGYPTTKRQADSQPSVTVPGWTATGASRETIAVKCRVGKKYQNEKSPDSRGRRIDTRTAPRSCIDSLHVV